MNLYNLQMIKFIDFSSSKILFTVLQEILKDLLYFLVIYKQHSNLQIILTMGKMICKNLENSIKYLFNTILQVFNFYNVEIHFTTKHQMIDFNNSEKILHSFKKMSRNYVMFMCKLKLEHNFTEFNKSLKGNCSLFKFLNKFL